MPRYFYDNARSTVESTKSFSIFWLKAKGFLEKDAYNYNSINWSRNGEPTGNISFRIDTRTNSKDSGNDYSYIELDYRVKNHWENEWRDKKYKIRLLRTSCNYGGFRWWFQCVNCGKRVGVLYSTSDYFVCRHCANLSYQSCNDSMRGVYRILARRFRADNYYEKIGRLYYKGKPTRKYKRYLRLRGNYSDKDIAEILDESLII